MTKEEIIEKINELKEKKAEAEQKARLQDVFQHSYKIFLNSVYGFTGTQYSPVYNRDIAESVTLTGQATIKEMVKYTNKCLNVIGKTEGGEWVIAGDTDSVESDSIIDCDGKETTIENLFNEISKEDNVDKLENGTDVAISVNDHFTKSLNGICKIKNVSRHKVNKEIWNISTPKNKDLKITKDHSIMVYRDGEIIECKPSEIKNSDYLISFS